MNHYVAFLRGINLGKRRVAMERLRAVFQSMEFADVSTFIASGNVLFSSPTRDGPKLEKQIEAELERSLGFEVDTFVRSQSQVLRAIADNPFPGSAGDDGSTVHIGFLKDRLPRAAEKRLSGLRTLVDEIQVNGRELYWLCRIPTHESKVWASPEVKAAEIPTQTFRNLKMLRRLAHVFAAS